MFAVSKPVHSHADHDNVACLSPPRLAVGTEVSLCPGAEGDDSALVNITVGKGKWKRGRSTDNGSGGGVLQKGREEFS